MKKYTSALIAIGALTVFGIGSAIAQPFPGARCTVTIENKAHTNISTNIPGYTMITKAKRVVLPGTFNCRQVLGATPVGFFRDGVVYRQTGGNPASPAPFFGTRSDVAGNITYTFAGLFKHPASRPNCSQGLYDATFGEKNVLSGRWVTLPGVNSQYGKVKLCVPANTTGLSR